MLLVYGLEMNLSSDTFFTMDMLRCPSLSSSEVDDRMERVLKVLSLKNSPMSQESTAIVYFVIPCLATSINGNLCMYARVIVPCTNVMAVCDFLF